MTDPIANACATAVAGVARLVTGVRGEWRGGAPDPRPRVYFANHRSHGDFVLLWTVLPSRLRRTTRPVAGADYWLDGKVRKFIGQRVFRAVLVDRRGRHGRHGRHGDETSRAADPVATMGAALDRNDSLILFPEGTRNTSDEPLLAFKCGLYHLASARPDVALVPAWIDNLNRVMPKGEVIPIPLLCTVTVGPEIRLHADEDKTAFLNRSREALLALAPGGHERHGPGR